MIDLRPGYDRVLRCRSGPNGISACLGVVTTPPYLVTTTLVVTTLVSRGCNLSVQQRPVYTASKTWFESGERTELLARQVVLKNAGVLRLLGCRHTALPHRGHQLTDRVQREHVRVLILSVVRCSATSTSTAYTCRDAYFMYSVGILSSPHSCQSTTGVHSEYVLSTCTPAQHNRVHLKIH